VAEVPAVMVTVAALLAIDDTDIVVSQLGALIVAMADEVVYQVMVPFVPAAMLAVVTEKLAVPPLLAVIVPDCVPRLTVGTESVDCPEADVGLLQEAKAKKRKNPINPIKK